MAWLRARPWIRVAAALVAFAAVAVVTALIAEPRMHTIFATYDDEGYMLTALQSFIDRGSLYDDVFTQYGPFYYGAWGGLFSAFGIPVDHDSGRAVTQTVWVLSSLALGLGSWRITGSALLGLGVQMLAFAALGVLVNEPMHAGGMITLLLVAIVCIASFVGERLSLWPMALLGGAIGALILTKVNVGGFALISLALVCACTYPVLSSRRWLRLAVELLFVALPLLLLASKFGEEWARHYAVHVAIAALAVVIVLRARSQEERPAEELVWIVGGLLAVALTTCIAIVGSGTSLGGLIDGVIRQPLRQGDAFTIPLGLSGRIWVFDAIALAGAIAYWFVSRGRGVRPSPALQLVFSSLSLLLGVELALSVIGKTFPYDSLSMVGYPFSLLAFAWVALVPPPATANLPSRFARLLLPPLAVLQALHAFPVAGSQVMWSTFLLIPIGAICVANGVRGIAAALTDANERIALGLAGAAAAVALTLFAANATLREPLDEARLVYDSRVSLDLPGAESIRLAPEEVESYHQIVAAINRNCGAFLAEPGMNSFYVWTGQAPPTGQNATAWMTLFDDERQQQVVDQTRSIDGLCLLRNVPLAAGWNGAQTPEGPLVDYLSRGFTPIAKVGDYELLRREGTESRG
ncbi:MAG TPA: hypothetical protein VF255_03330 [Solirubrobacterales bacterium]